MLVSRACPFHRISESIGIGKGPGYCDLDGNQTICDGDAKFCGKPDTMEQYLLIQILERKFREVEA